MNTTRTFITMGAYTYIRILDADTNETLGHLTPTRDELLNANPNYHLTTSPDFHRNLVGIIVPS